MKTEIKYALVKKKEWRPTQSEGLMKQRWEIELPHKVGLMFCEPIMGWTGNRSTENQPKYEFGTLEAAITFLKEANILYKIEVESLQQNIKPKFYLKKPPIIIRKF